MNFLLINIACLLAVCQSKVAEIAAAEQIFGGRDAISSEFPYQVSLQSGRHPFFTTHFCGGAIIQSFWVLTAAHCVAKKNRVPRNTIFVAIAGTTNLEETEASQQIRVWALSLIHEKYIDNNEAQPHDIGLIKVKTPFQFNARVQPIRLPARNSDAVGMATVTGWGRNNKSKRIASPTKLQAAQLPIISRKICQQMIQKFGVSIKVDEKNICCGPQANSKATCQGDSGGPLVLGTGYYRVLVGTVSWGPSVCGTPPSVFTRVGSYIDWIKANIAKN